MVGKRKTIEKLDLECGHKSLKMSCNYCQAYAISGSIRMGNVLKETWLKNNKNRNEVFISKGWTKEQQLKEAKIYLTEIHNIDFEKERDIHCFFYYLNFEVCPICNEWLVERVLPEFVS